jgi:hypothetical protein
MDVAVFPGRHRRIPSTNGGEWTHHSVEEAERRGVEEGRRVRYFLAWFCCGITKVGGYPEDDDDRTVIGNSACALD